MTQATVAHTTRTDSSAAGRELGEALSRGLEGASPDAVVVFASARYDHRQLLEGLNESCRPVTIVGCSSAGEFTSDSLNEGAACALALRSSEMEFTCALGRNLREDYAAAAAELVAGLRGPSKPRYPYRQALILTDALAGHADLLVEQLTELTGGTYRFFGGGAGDDARFQSTYVFKGTEAFPDSVVALEILSSKPIGIGVRHGWQPASAPMRVTEADGMKVVSLNAAPAVEAFESHASSTGQTFSEADPLPFFLHNVLGFSDGNEYKLRVPLGVDQNGSLACAADVPTGATTRIMQATSATAAEAAAAATKDAIGQLHGLKPSVALVFDCVATRLRTGREFGVELQSVQDALGTTTFVGCNTYGQVARAEGQFSGFHNCTAVVCVIPE